MVRESTKQIVEVDYDSGIIWMFSSIAVFLFRKEYGVKSVIRIERCERQKGCELNDKRYKDRRCGVFSSCFVYKND